MIIAWFCGRFNCHSTPLNIVGMWHSSNIYVSSYRATCLFDECQIIGKGLVCIPQLCCLDIRSTSIILNNVSSDITKQNKK